MKPSEEDSSVHSRAGGCEVTEEINSTVDRRLRRLWLEKREGKCSRCPAHARENLGRRPRDDKGKNNRRK